MPEITLLAAPPGAGKTTACLRFAAGARAAGLRVGGIAAPARCDATGARVGIDAVDLATLQRRPLADVVDDPILATVGHFRFRAVALAWSLGALLDALRAPLDAVVIDEIGPLELRGEGYAPALSALPHATCRHVIVVVRSALEGEVAARCGGLPVRHVALTASNRDAVPAILLASISAPSQKG